MPARKGSPRAHARRSGRGGGLKQVLLWALLIVGSFLVGALVVSPILNVVTADRQPARAAVPDGRSANEEPGRPAQPPAAAARPASPPEGTPDIRIGSPEPGSDVQPAQDPDTSSTDSADTPTQPEEPQQSEDTTRSERSRDGDTSSASPVDRPERSRNDAPRRSSRRSDRDTGNEPARPARPAGRPRDLSVQPSDSVD